VRVAKLIEIKKIEMSDDKNLENWNANEVIINVKACGLCGTDLHIFLHGREDVSFCFLE